MSEDPTRQGPLSVTPANDGRTPGEESLGDTSNSPLPAGPTVPRYRILGPIGFGGMGIVYRAEDTRLGRLVALKFLPPMLAPSPRAKAGFLKEARAASALDHPNICTIYEVGETAEGQLFLAMAFYQGETLRRRLDRGPLPVAEALSIALQVARGLAKAHRQGIVHRDIKPANLMITEDGVVKLLDFGIARMPDQTLSGPLLGTPGYMSPEQARVGAVDARSDVWSLGVVLREMLTGWRPGDSGQAEPLPEDAPLGLEGILSRMLAEEPANRFPDAAALLADLSALERAAAGPERTSVPRPARRWRRVWAVLLVGAVALAVAGGSWLLRNVRRHAGDEQGPSQAAPTAPAEPPEKERFLSHLTDLPGKEWFPSLNPEGNLFVYAKTVGGRSRLFLQAVGGGAAQDLSSNSLGGDSQPAFSPDGNRIAFRSEREGGGIFVMGAMGESVSRLTKSGFNPAWSPDGQEIVYADEGVDSPQVRRYDSKIHRINLVTGQHRLVSDVDAVQPNWSPHGHRIAYWGISPSGRRVIWTIPADGGQPVKVTEGKSDWNPVWSPDGRYLYFASARSGIMSLWRVRIDERTGIVKGRPEPVNTSGQASMLSFSRDGSRMVYAGDETRTTLEKVALAPASGAVQGPAATITETANLIAALDASRDGRWLVYQTQLPQEDLFLIQPDGTGRRRLTHDEYNDRQPRWSPDAERIAFYSNRGGRYEIWTIRADGSQLERAAILPRSPQLRPSHPIWSPDGRQLATDLDEQEALIDLTRPMAERHPRFLPPADRGMGFSASSWSADSFWLAGALHQRDGTQLPGIVLYSLIKGTYVQLTPRGESATWLSDNRRILYKDGGKLFLLDTQRKTSRQVLAPAPGSEYNDFCLSADNRVLYLARNNEQGDIWMLTMK